VHSLLERQLQYGPLVLIELAETLALNIFAIVAVELGAGVWGMACAAVFRALVGALHMVKVSPVGLVVPASTSSRCVRFLRSALSFKPSDSCSSHAASS
jgi:hypothetical protein